MILILCGYFLGIGIADLMLFEIPKRKSPSKMTEWELDELLIYGDNVGEESEQSPNPIDVVREWLGERRKYSAIFRKSLDDKRKESK